MKDKYNNFVISFDDDQEFDNWYENINKSFPDIDKEIFSDICKFILRVDKSIIGRFAGDIRDLIALASSRYVTSKKMINSDVSNLAHVEIGTLFGASAILTDHIIKANSASNKFQNIMIDPLNGYYGNSSDLVTGLEVNAKTLLKNLKLFNVEGYELIQKYSTDKHAIKKIKEFSIASLFIDGDHSFSGLLKDWNNFNKEVMNGGHVIIDNVNDKNWPNINLFIDELKSKIGKQWEIIYEGSVTLVLEKKCDDILLIDTKFDLNTIHNIEKQVDQKFYKLINNEKSRINTRDQDIKKRDGQILSLEKQHSKALEKINTRDQDIKKRDGQILSLEKQHSKALERINTRDQDITKRDGQILNLDKQHAKALERINTRDQGITKRDEQILNLGKQHAKALERINTRDQDIKKRDRQILNLDKQHAKALEKINTRDQDIKKRDGQINILLIKSEKDRVLIQKLTNLLKLINKPLSLLNLKLKRTINVFLAGLK